MIRFHAPSLDRADRRAVDRVLRSGWLTTGAETFRFEASFAKYVGAPHAVGVTSCTAALHLACVALGIGEGDEVITSPITWPSTANILCHVGAVPVFADVDPGTLLLNPADVEARVTRRTKAILPVHYAGHPCEMDALNRIARRHGLRVIQDSAHSIESRYNGERMGSLGDAACYSFYATKNITTGEGGMLTTSDARLADRIRSLRLHGISRDAWDRYGEKGYRHWECLEAGYKYNMFDLQAALGNTQLPKIEAWWKRRRAIFDRYERELGSEDRFRTLEIRKHVRSAYHLCVLRLNLEAMRMSRDEVLLRVQQAGVGLGVHFRALHLQPFYRKRFGFRPGMLPVAEEASDRILSIPLYPGLKDSEVTRVIRTLKKEVR